LIIHEPGFAGKIPATPEKIPEAIKKRNSDEHFSKPGSPRRHRGHRGDFL
jgi:hypothetical protein